MGNVTSESQAGGVHAHRVIFIDLARALAAVFMLYGHTVSALLAPPYQTGTWFDIWIFQRGLTSSLFLLLSGFAFSIATGRHWSSHGYWSAKVFRRVRRFALFVLLGYALHFPVQRFADFPHATPEQWRTFLAVDVLQLIGVTFVIVQGLVMVTRSRRAFGWTTMVLAVVTVVATPAVWSTDWSAWPQWLAAYLSPAAGSQFPFFPWAGYVFAGAALGQLYVRLGAARLASYAVVGLLVPGVGLVAVALLADSVTTTPADAVTWNWVPAQVALRLGASLVLLAAIARASQRISRLPHVFGAIAQETLLIYFVHLCIVYGSIWNRGLVQIVGPMLGPGGTVVCVVVLIAAMAGLAWYWNWFKHVRPRVARWTSLAIGGLLLYRLL